MEIWAQIHGLMRWLVALMVTGAIVLTFVGWFRSIWTSLLRGALRILAIFLTVQFVLGVVLLISNSSEVAWNIHALRLQYEHATLMLVSLAMSHMALLLARRSPTRRRLVMMFTLLLIMGILIALGVIRLRGVSYWIP